jgi:hypothetical protein
MIYTNRTPFAYESFAAKSFQKSTNCDKAYNLANYPHTWQASLATHPPKISSQQIPTKRENITQTVQFPQYREPINKIYPFAAAGVVNQKYEHQVLATNTLALSINEV